MGSGYTVEGQKTSEEKHGGLQLEVTPEMMQGKQLWSYAKQQYITFKGDNKYRNDGLKEFYTPRELGCKIGDVLRSYPNDPTYQTRFQIRDLVTSEVEEMGENKLPQDFDSYSMPLVELKADGGIMPMYPPTLALRCSPGTQARDSTLFQSFSSTLGLTNETGLANGPRSSLSPPLSSSLRSTSSPLTSALPVMRRQSQSSRLSSCQSDVDAAQGITMHAKTESEGRRGLMELTETQVKNIKTMGLAAGGKLSTLPYIFAFLCGSY